MKRKGFTLIELLVVIAIIGLLSTLAVVSLNSARGKARDAQRVSDVKQISTALEIFFASEDTYLAVNFVADPLIFSASTHVPGFDIETPGNFKDPSDVDAVACDGTEDETERCNYTITDMDGDSYIIQFSLEDGSGNLDAGAAYITTGGIMGNGIPS